MVFGFGRSEVDVNGGARGSVKAGPDADSRRDNGAVARSEAGGDKLKFRESNVVAAWTQLT